jgi:hypothetical protein
VRCRGHGLGSWRVGNGRHRALGIQQMVLAGTQAQLDESAGIGDALTLPAVIGLVAAHGFFARLVPCAGGFAGQIMRADQGFLNGLSAFGVDFLLAAGAHRLLSRGTFPGGCGVRPACRCPA